MKYIVSDKILINIDEQKYEDFYLKLSNLNETMQLFNALGPVISAHLCFDLNKEKTWDKM